MGGTSRAASIGAGALLAVGCLVGIATPASALPSAKVIQCPDHSSKVSGELDYTHTHGALVEKYLTYGAEYNTSHSVYRIDGHFEEFATEGVRLGRICFDQRPDRNHGKAPSEWEFLDSSGSRGGSAVGHYTHTPSPYHLAGITTKWVKWKVAVN